MPVESVNLFDKKEEFKPTADEVRVIGEKMKDPEFAKLMHEYMESLQDPETKREEEAYLEQMEREAKEGGDFSFEFIFPKPAFAVELLEVGSKKRVLVNMCSSDKVDEYREETTNNRQSANWHVPVSISKERDETYNGQPVKVYDACFNPKTLAIGDRSDRFVCFLVEVVVENINQGYTETFGFKFMRQPSAVKSVGTPQNQTVRKQNGKSAFPLADDPVSKGPIKPTKGAAVAAKAAATAAPAAAKASPAQPAAAAAADSKPAAPAPSSVPKHTILHRGEIDLTAAWNWKVVDTRVGIPKELIIKLELPEAASAGDLDIDVTEHYIDIAKSTRHPYSGMIALPFSVDATPVAAKFDKTKRVLSLTLRVVPPEKPAEAMIPAELLPQINKNSTSNEESEGAAEKEAAAPAPAPAAAAEEPRAAAPPSPPKVESIAPAAAAAPAPAPPAPKPELHELSGDGDRMAQLMAKIAQARKEREEAEAAQRAEEEATASAAAAAAAAAAAEPTKADEDAVEVIDLRKKQQAWLDGVKQQERERDEAQELLAEEAQRKADDEAKKKLKEARKKMEEEREAERAEAKMKEAMDRLPLKSKYIFDIC